MASTQSSRTTLGNDHSRRSSISKYQSLIDTTKTLSLALNRYEDAISHGNLSDAGTIANELKLLWNEWCCRVPHDGEINSIMRGASRAMEEIQLPPLSRSRVKNLGITSTRHTDLGIYNFVPGNVLRRITSDSSPTVKLFDIALPPEQTDWPFFASFSRNSLIGFGECRPKQLLEAAMLSFRDKQKPLFVRHLAKQLAGNICSVFSRYSAKLQPWEITELIGIGRRAEQMMVAEQQQAALVGKRSLQARSKGGKKRAQQKSSEKARQQRRLMQIMQSQKISKLRACEILSKETGVAAATLNKKLSSPRSGHRR